MVDIHVPTHRGVTVPDKQVFPSPGDLLLDCACGSREWVVHVTPRGPDLDVAFASELVCTGCKRVIHLVQGCLESDGKVNVRGKN